MAYRPKAGRSDHIVAFHIVSRLYTPFDGAGTYRWGSRWISPGRYVIHAASAYSLAVLENLVHWQTNTPPNNLVCVEVKIPNSVSQLHLAATAIRGWEENGDDISCAAGDAWYDSAQSAVLWVPSVVSPFERNLLINQRHPDFSRIRACVRDETIDKRLLRSAPK